jgi:phage terminase large subunit-like protein
MITNSGSDRKSFCWEEHEHAIAVATGAVKDDRTFSYVCALDDGDDPLTDPSCWKKANPLLGVTITNEYLRGVVKQALDLPSKQNNILRLHFCQWTDSATAWLPRAKLEACEDPAMTIEQFAGKRCHAGLDLSATKDLTAKALVFDDGWKDVPDPEKTGLMKRKPTYALFVKAWTPAETLRERQRADKAPYDQWVKDGHLIATPGPVIRLDFVAADLKDDHDRYELAGVAYDRYLIRAFERDMAEIGIDQVIPMHDHPQSVARRQQTELWMPGSVDMFETLVLEGRIRIAVNPVLRSAIAGHPSFTATSM